MSDQANNDDRRDACPTELAAFQAALARLSPAPDGVNIARLLFRAGQLSGPRRSLTWPCLTAASLLLAAVLGTALLFHLTQPTERIVTVYVPAAAVPALQPDTSIPSTEGSAVAPTASVPGGGDSDYLRLRQEVLAHGLDALPPPTMWSTAVPAVNAETLLEMPHGNPEPWLQRLKHSLQSGGPS